MSALQLYATRKVLMRRLKRVILTAITDDLLIQRAGLLFAVVVSVGLLASCKSTEQPNKEVSTSVQKVTKPVTYKLAWTGKHTDSENWTAHVLAALPEHGKEMLTVTPKDYKTFCPNLSRLTLEQRIEFYAHLLSIMVKRESTFKPNATYDETTTKPSLKGVISRGLLQISVASAKSYGCEVEETKDLHDPLINLTCGIKILNRWIGERDHQIAGMTGGNWRGGARYWAVLRDLKGKSSYAEIKSYTRALPICKR